ncbi:MAG: hypothetical protein LWX83_05755 [Anaerolineae bacterium]|nr:hypothetical protein [Anaerolineae bacterium]
MYEIRVNVNKNRLYMTVKGFMDFMESKIFANSVLQEANKLKPGFGCVSDLSEFVPGNEEVRNIVMDAVHNAQNIGAGPAMRVVKQKDLLVENQLSSSLGYGITQVYSYEEADKKLDGWLLLMN